MRIVARTGETLFGVTVCPLCLFVKSITVISVLVTSFTATLTMYGYEVSSNVVSKPEGMHFIFLSLASMITQLVLSLKEIVVWEISSSKPLPFRVRMSPPN